MSIWWLDHFGYFLLGFVVLVGFLIAFSFYKESKRPSFSLKKDDWICTKYKKESSTSYIMIGNILTPITTENDVCVQWSKK